MQINSATPKMCVKCRTVKLAVISVFNASGTFSRALQVIFVFGASGTLAGQLPHTIRIHRDASCSSRYIMLCMCVATIADQLYTIYTHRPWQCIINHAEMLKKIDYVPSVYARQWS